MSDDPPRARTRRDRAVVGVLRSPMHRLLSGALVEIRYTSRRTGATRCLPVQYACDGDDLVVYPAHWRDTTWWRNLGGGPPVEVLLRGVVYRAQAQLLGPADPARPRAVGAYLRRWPQVTVEKDAPLVVLTVVARAPQARWVRLPRARPAEPPEGLTAVRARGGPAPDGPAPPAARPHAC